MPIYVFGSNAINQLGLGEEADDTIVPKELEFFKDKQIKSIACGSLHTLALTTDNKLYSWGCNDEGALGRTGNESVPKEVILPEVPVKMACGDSVSAVITNKQNLYAWGTFRNLSGIFGFDPEFTDICAGANFICLLSVNNTIWTFGSNDFYELGRATSLRSPDSCLNPESIFSTRKRKINYRFSKIAAGKSHGLGINTDKDVFSWGSNIYGQLGIGHDDVTFNKPQVDIHDVVEVAGGENHSLFLTGDGSLYACGSNIDGQLGIPTGVNYNAPTKIEISNVSRIRSYGNFSIAQVGNSLYSFGSCYSGGTGFDESCISQPMKIPFEFPEIVDFQVGFNFTIVATK